MADKTVTVKPSGGTYTTLQAAITGEVAANANLTAAGMDGILHIEIGGDWSSGADTTAVNVTGFTTDASHYIHIYTDSSNRASLAWSTSKYRLSLANTTALQVNQNDVLIDGVQLSISGTVNNLTGFYCNPTGASNIKIANCFIDDTTSSGSSHDGVLHNYNDSSGSVTVYNCVIRGWRGTGLRPTPSAP